MTSESNIGNLWNSAHPRIHNYLTASIEDPLAYDCNVAAYIHGHRQLLIEVTDPAATEYKPHCYIGLEFVWYFEGPLSWHGVDFRLGSLDERKALLSEGWIDTGDALHEMADQFAPLLFILEHPRANPTLVYGSVMPECFRLARPRCADRAYRASRLTIDDSR